MLALLRNPAEAEDVTQTTFLNAYRAIQAGEEPQRPAELADRDRAQRLPLACPLRDAPAEGGPARRRRRPSWRSPEPERLNIRELLRAFGRLPFNQRAALTMREFEGRSYPEIAETLGVTVPAVEALIVRARKTLRAQAAAIRGLAVVGLPRSLRRLVRARARRRPAVRSAPARRESGRSRRCGHRRRGSRPRDHVKPARRMRRRRRGRIVRDVALVSDAGSCGALRRARRSGDGRRISAAQPARRRRLTRLRSPGCDRVCRRYARLRRRPHGARARPRLRRRRRARPGRRAGAAPGAGAARRRPQRRAAHAVPRRAAACRPCRRARGPDPAGAPPLPGALPPTRRCRPSRRPRPSPGPAPAPPPLPPRPAASFRSQIRRASFPRERHLNERTCPRPYPPGAMPPAGPGGDILFSSVR